MDRQILSSSPNLVRRSHGQEEGQIVEGLAGRKPQADAGGDPQGTQAVVRYLSLEAAEEGKEVMTNRHTPTVIFYASGAVGTTEIPLPELYAMFVAVRRGMAQIRIRDTSHGAITLYTDVSYLDHRKTFQDMYNEEDFR